MSQNCQVQQRDPRAEEVTKLREEYAKLRLLATTPFEHAILDGIARLVPEVYSNDR